MEKKNLICSQDTCESEVAQFDVFKLVQEDVLTLYISVNNGLLLQVLQACRSFTRFVFNLIDERV